MRISRWDVIVTAGALVTVACGSDDASGGPPPSDIDPMVPASSISMSQLAEFCDWSNARLGGYGRMESCGNGVTVSTFPSHDVCASHPIPSTCPATVGQLEDCVSAMSRAGPSLCSLASAIPAECQALRPECAVFI